VKVAIFILLFAFSSQALPKWRSLTFDSTDVTVVTYVKNGKKCEDTCKTVWFDYSPIGGYRLDLLNGKTVFVRELKSAYFLKN